jgi:hypothetical protein
MSSPSKKPSSLLSLLLALLPACAGGSEGGSSGGDDGSGVASFTPGGDLVVDEDTAVSQTAWATEVKNGALFTLSIVDPSLFHTLPAINGFGDLTFVPAENKNGSTDVTVILQNTEGLATSPVSFRVTISPVNDPPSFDVGEDITVEAASGSHLVEAWASNIAAGPTDEASQGLSFVIESNSAPELFGTPAVLLSSNGNLSFNLADGSAGEATITVSLVDDGGTSGLGAGDSSASTSFTLTVEDTIPPSAEILYPPTGSLTDASTVSVFGTANDMVEVDFVRLNGLPADTVDGFASWSRQGVALNPNTSIAAHVGDASGNHNGGAASVEISGGRQLPIHPTALAFDATQSRLIFYSAGYGALFSYFPATEEVILFAEPAEGSSWEILALVFSPSPPALYALEGGSKSVLAFDLSTGEESLISGVGRGAGLSFDQPIGLTFVKAAAGSPPSLAVSDHKFGPEDSPAIVAVAISTGDRSVISSSSDDDLVVARGIGPELNSPAGLHYQKAFSRFLVVDVNQKALISVDKDTGDRVTLITNDNSEDGVSMTSPSDIALSSNGETAWLLDPIGKKVFRANLPSSTLSLFCSNSAPVGVNNNRWSSPRNFSYKSGIGLFVSDHTEHTIFSVATSSGLRTAALSMRAGAGPEWKSPNEMIVDESVGTGFISCSSSDAIYTVSLVDGERSLLSGDGAGAGVVMLEPVDVAVLDAASLIVIDVGAGQPRVLRVTRSGGARSLVSGQGVGGGVSFNSASSVAVNASANAAYVLDPLDNTITSVNLDTGNRYRVAGGGVGSGPALSGVASIAWHNDTARLFLLQAGSVLSIDPTSLERTTLCDLELAGLNANASGRITCPLGQDYVLASLSSPLSVAKISTVTGSAAVICSASSTEGPPISEIAGLGYSSLRTTLYLLNPSMNALHAVNAPANEQVIFSRP